MISTSFPLCLGYFQRNWYLASYSPSCIGAVDYFCLHVWQHINPCWIPSCFYNTFLQTIKIVLNSIFSMHKPNSTNHHHKHCKHALFHHPGHQCNIIIPKIVLWKDTQSLQVQQWTTATQAWLLFSKYLHSLSYHRLHLNGVSPFAYKTGCQCQWTTRLDNPQCTAKFKWLTTCLKTLWKLRSQCTLKTWKKFKKICTCLAPATRLFGEKQNRYQC